ncbi:MAG: hypothetical protein QME58_08895 [Bacteroidota bacterium]|nr:hypothetical protein [Bacteroidota bacterium]
MKTITQNNKRKSVRINIFKKSSNKFEYSVEDFLKKSVPMFQGDFHVFDQEVSKKVDLRTLAYKR